MNEEDFLKALKKKARSIAPIYVEAMFASFQERIAAADDIGATQCPAKEFGSWEGLWDKQPAKEITILDFVRGATRTGGGFVYFTSYKSRSEKIMCLMAHNVNGKSACLISHDDYYALSYPVRQQLEEFLAKLVVTFLYEVALRLIQTGCTLSFIKNPEKDPRIGVAEEDLDEAGYDGEYNMYINISWTHLPHIAKQPPVSGSPTERSWWQRIIGD